MKSQSESINLQCKDILLVDNSIRFVAICSKEGKMLEIKYREDISPLLNEKELLYSIIKSVERNKIRKESEEKLDNWNVTRLLEKTEQIQQNA